MSARTVAQLVRTIVAHAAAASGCGRGLGHPSPPGTPGTTPRTRYPLGQPS
ncbi:hypothetical protein [Tsukamurella soli]|uniref:hypothetical protein n=1 Tax=Tsukamurella soli TaxID=644556 RepID=UPI0031EA2943